MEHLFFLLHCLVTLCDFAIEMALITKAQSGIEVLVCQFSEVS